MSILDVDAACAYLVDGAPSHEVPPHVPPTELSRSPAAARVGALAKQNGLILAHFEHRAALPLGDDAVEPVWVDGVLPESKYGSFWHELPVGSFHPGHRAKWGAHELCHGLVGSAWAPGAPPLFLATAGRLAELVPVVLWYFLDEIGLARCPDHDGPLFRRFCPACEAAAVAPVPMEPGAARDWLTDANRFLDRELAAVARSRRLGRPVPHVWGSLDLCSDGVAYAANHAHRLDGDAFRMWAERFVTPGVALVPSLDALEERALEVVRGIAQGTPVAPWDGDRSTWVAMDVGARIAQVVEHASDPSGLVPLLDALASTGDVGTAFTAYADWAAHTGGPSELDVFAVGYPIPGVPTRSVAQIGEGLQTVVPLTLAAFEDAGLDPVPDFVEQDRVARISLGERFAAYVATISPGAAADLAAYEAMLRRASVDPVNMALGAGEGVRLADGAQVRSFPIDPMSLADAVDTGAIEGRAVDGRLVLDAVPDAPVTLVVARDLHDDLLVVEVPGATAEQVQQAPGTLDAELQGSLVELGILGADRWPTAPDATR